ncbi:MAG: TetR/AcrR family transcriptional regulator [Clostridiales bacterium]|nr:TetR/AcrR family transcriptional regulator [Candidatus Equinaster intestinalis]
MAKNTKAVIKAAFLELLKQHPMASITVQDIVNVCGLNRNTFYYHFDDVPALLSEIILDYVDEMKEKYYSPDCGDKFIDAILHWSLEYKAELLHIFRSVPRESFEKSLHRLCIYMYNIQAEHFINGRNISHEDKEIIKHYFVCESFAESLFWLEEGLSEDKIPELHRQLQIFQGVLDMALKRAEGKKTK